MGRLPLLFELRENRTVYFFAPELFGSTGEMFDIERIVTASRKFNYSSEFP